MAKGLITKATLDDIADAIRSKLGTQDTYLPEEMAAAILSIPSGGSQVDIVPWSSGSDEEIVAMLEAAHNGDIDLQQDGGWAVGDTRTISISAFTGGNNTSFSAQSMDIVISSFSDYNSCGCVMQFDFKNCLSPAVRMSDSSAPNDYTSSEIFLTTLPALVNALPTWLKEGLITFNALNGAGNKVDTLVTVSNNKLALRAAAEVVTSPSDVVEGEGTLIPYYSTQANRIKKVGNTDSKWYLRSPRTNSTYEYKTIGMGGYSDSAGRSTNCGLSPFGCL